LPGGTDDGGGPCIWDVYFFYSYTCDGNNIPQRTETTVIVPDRSCTPEEIADVLVSGPFILPAGGGSVQGEGGASSSGSGGSGGGGAVPPSVSTTTNCNPAISNIDENLGNTASDAGDPPVSLSPLVVGTDQTVNAYGASGMSSPRTFFATALGNLGLISGQAGNAGYSASDAAQVAGTITTYDQVETDLAGLFSTASENGASLGITGDINLLQQIDTRLEAVTTAENLLFGRDADWLDTKQDSTLQQWLTDFYTDVQSSPDGSIDPAAETQLLATTLPSSVSTSEATEFIQRWNQTVQYWGQGIFTAAQVPSGQSTDFLDLGALQAAFNGALSAEQESQADGYADPLAECQAALTTVQNDLSQMGVCATVKLQIDQTATLTRSAFSGTLTITNSDVVMNISITDSLGNPANGEFYISSPTYSGAFSVVNGIATLPDNGTGSIAFTFIPDDTAAGNGATLFDIGGTIGFTDPSGGNVSIPVFPTTITVYPQAELQLNYFLQQDVIGADPLDPQESVPSEPAVLGLLVTNSGMGAANNLSITTAQPQIVQNEKGLQDTFQIVGTQVDGQEETPSLEVDFGNVEPGQTADAEFLLTSTLQGIFTDFTASFTHSDALGGLDTSLISSVTTHTLIHAGVFQYPDEPSYPGETSYLAEDNANPGNLPDTIYFSDGTTAPVNIATDVQSTATSTPGVYTLAADVTSGWDYLQLPDPGAGYTLYQVVRSDGEVVPVSDQAWTTDRTFDAAGNSTLDYQLHILDYDSTGSYTVYYKPASATAPAIESLGAVSGLQPAPVGSVTVTFNEAINPATFTASNLSLTLNGGGNLIDSSVTVTQTAANEFTIGNLAGLTSAYGNYTLSVSAAGVSDYLGDIGAGTTADSWTYAPGVPAVVSVGAANPTLTNMPLQTADVVLSEPIVPSSFTDSALSLTLNGGPNLIDSGVTITQVNSTTYEIAGLASLTAAQGNYVLSVSAGGMVDADGNSGVGALSETWTMNTTGPTVVSIAQTTVNNGFTIQSPRSIVVPTLYVRFSEPIDPGSFTYQAIAFSKDGGANLIVPNISITEVSPTVFEVSDFENLTYPVDGDYTFTVNAAGVEDLAGNSGTGSASVGWDLITTGPAEATGLAISPLTGVSSTAVNVQDVTLSGSLSETGLVVDVSDNGTDLGDATVTGTTFSEPLTLQAGTNNITVYAVDVAANISPTASLTVFYQATPPVISQLQSPPAEASQPVGSLAVTFSEAIVPSTFTAADVSLTENGRAVPLSGLTITPNAADTTWTIGGLAPFNTAFGAYGLTVSAAGVQDLAGNAGTGSAAVSWSILGAPTVTVSAPNETYTALAYAAATATVTGNGGAAISDGSLSLKYYAAGNLSQALLGAPTAAGSYDVVAVFSGDTDYAAATSPPVAFTIGKAPLRVAANSVSLTYGQAVPAMTGTVSGLVGADATSVAYVFATTAVRGDAPGTYDISDDASDPLDVLGNYDITYVPATVTITKAAPTVTLTGPSGKLVYNGTSGVTAWARPLLAGVSGGVAPTGTAAVAFYAGSSATGTPLSSPPVNAGTYTAVANYPGDTNYAAASSNAVTFTVNQAPVQLALQSDLDWALLGQELDFLAVASTTAANGGTPLTPDGAVTFYDNGAALATQPLAVVDGQDEAVFDTATLASGVHAITVGYTSASGNFATISAPPVLTELVFPSGAEVLTVDNTSGDPAVADSLPWAVAQADASNVAAVIGFAAGSGQAFATPQTVTLEATLDVTDTNLVAIEGPASGLTLVGDYSQSRFPVLSVAQGAGVLLRGVSVGTQSPGANGDLQVAGVLDVLQSVANLGSAMNVTGGGSVDLGGQAVTADTLTLSDGSVADGTLSTGARTVLSGTASANLTGSGGLVKEGAGTVALSGNNTYGGGTAVLAGTLIVNSAASLPDGSSLTIGAGASQLFDASPSGQATVLITPPNVLITLPRDAFSSSAPDAIAAPGTSVPTTAAASRAAAAIHDLVLQQWMNSGAGRTAGAGENQAHPSGPAPTSARDRVLSAGPAAAPVPGYSAQPVAAWLWDWIDSQDQNDKTSRQSPAAAAIDKLLERY
jgi:autotransporter-associated beta strand protein